MRTDSAWLGDIGDSLSKLVIPMIQLRGVWISCDMDADKKQQMLVVRVVKQRTESAVMTLKLTKMLQLHLRILYHTAVGFG